ncbi:MAG TPA: hypothetical protein VF257_14875 [Solirubrobacteraceae bacterium]
MSHERGRPLGRGGERASTATPPPASAAADAAAAILPAVSASTIAWARTNELAARSWTCIDSVS